MAIQLRRGAYADFDPQKMKPAEVAVVQQDDPTSHDGKAVYVAISPGDVKRMAVLDELQDEVYNQIDTAISTATLEAAGNAEAWAVGNRGGSAVPSTDPTYHNNSKYYAEQAAESARTLTIDSTLTLPGQPADAKATGDAISNLTAAIAAIGSGISDIVKAALLACFRHVAWTDEHGQTYYDALESALYADQYPKITATFNPGTNIIYTDDDISTLKQYLTVKHYESASDSGTTVSANDYTLTGTLTAGTSTIIVAYNGLTTTLTINGVVDFYNTWEWKLSTGAIASVHGPGTIDTTTHDIWINTANTSLNEKRRLAVTNRGKKAIVDYTTRQPLSYYPIPIPSTASKYTVSTVQSGYYVGCEVFVLADGEYSYYSGAGTAAAQEPITKTFTPSANLFLIVPIRADSDGSTAFAETEPSEIMVVFE